MVPFTRIQVQEILIYKNQKTPKCRVVSEKPRIWGFFWAWRLGPLCINEKLLCQKRSAYKADFRPYTAYMHILHHIFAYIQHAFIKIWLFQQTLIIDFCRIMSLPADPLTISSLGENKSGTISRNSTPPIPLLSVGQARPLVLLFLYSAPAPLDHSIHLRYASLVF